MQRYLLWAALALVGYSLFTPLAKLATENAPSTVVALVANSMLALSALAVVVATGEQPTRYLTGDTLYYVLGAGVFLTIGILAYYQALSLGPASTVIPIFGMFIVGSSVLSFLFLGDEFTARKGAGILLAGVAVYLTVTG
ncbi:EamA family transporter [Halomarina oriensis]|uniref:EamA family transporter n=1 Tax=Halomarina oriensis TaxID=671145 RepID=A0A6B0GTX5_9EURY|nr:EamA family transporter [Halomarina oriensis]MWG36817.1 EamA family transporter [Halomarina oriensis]